VTPAGVNISTIGNAASARSRGVEGSVNWRLSRFVSLKSDLAYNDSRYLSYSNAGCTTLQLATTGTKCKQDLSGRTRAFAPALTATGSATFTLPIRESASLRLVPIIYYTDGYYENPTLDPLTYEPKYAKVDFRVAYGPDNGRWEIAVLGKNLTNKYTYNQAAALSSSNGTRYVFPDAPRTISISLSIKG